MYRTVYSRAFSCYHSSWSRTLLSFQSARSLADPFLSTTVIRYPLPLILLQRILNGSTVSHSGRSLLHSSAKERNASHLFSTIPALFAKIPGVASRRPCLFPERGTSPFASCTSTLFLQKTRDGTERLPSFFVHRSQPATLFFRISAGACLCLT